MIELKPLYSHSVIVRVNSYLEPDKWHGEDGENGTKTIHVDPFHNIEMHTRIFGEVTHVPKKLGKYPMYEDHIGSPSYEVNPVSPFHHTDSIEMEVKVGDKIYFHYNCMKPNRPGQSFNQNHIQTIMEEGPDGKKMLFYYYRIKYPVIYAAIRYHAIDDAPPFVWNNEHKLEKMDIESDNEVFRIGEHCYVKEVVMIGSHAFIEADMETWEDVLVPIPMVDANGNQMIDNMGKPMMKPKDKWLALKATPEERSLQGTIRYIGSELKDRKKFFEKGDYVHFKNHADTKILFEGKELFRLQQRHIFARRD